MTKEQMIEIIHAFEQELWNERKESINAFGYGDESTQRIINKWLVIDELITKLNIEKNEKRTL